jgi:meso-butanediol dehydrogenase / (S,S)-butanediol dehydrogenase / diacetyl reductase
MRRRFIDKVALVSGGASGIGEATARRLAAEGASVVVFDRAGAAAEGLAAEIGGLAVAGDAASRDDAELAVGRAIERFGSLEVVVCCPGGDAGSAALLETSASDWSTGMALNLGTAVSTTAAALPALVASRGALVIVSSVAALASAPASTAYQTAKAGLLGFVRSIAVDYGPAGVRANAVCPAWTRTPTADAVIADFAQAAGVPVAAAYERATAMTPLRRPADAAELASACAFLASEDASYVTGAILVADGGTMAVNASAGAFSSFAPVSAR